MKRAYTLWLQYKTQTTEYRAIAAALGMSSLALNAKCQEIRQSKRNQKEAAE